MNLCVVWDPLLSLPKSTLKTKGDRVFAITDLQQVESCLVSVLIIRYFTLSEAEHRCMQRRRAWRGLTGSVLRMRRGGRAAGSSGCRRWDLLRAAAGCRHSPDSPNLRRRKGRCRHSAPGRLHQHLHLEVENNHFWNSSTKANDFGFKHKLFFSITHSFKWY